MTSPSDFLLRAARGSEASLLSEVARRSKAHWGYSRELLELWREDLTIDTAFIEKHPVFVCEVDGAVDGWGAIVVAQGTGEPASLEHLWVEPRAMGRGVGRRLIEHACSLARSLELDNLHIVADPEAAGFYERLGAIRQGEVESRPNGRRLPTYSLPVHPTAPDEHR